MGCPHCRPVFSPLHVVNTPVMGTMFQFVRRTPRTSRDSARARNATVLMQQCIGPHHALKNSKERHGQVA